MRQHHAAMDNRRGHRPRSYLQGCAGNRARLLLLPEFSLLRPAVSLEPFSRLQSSDATPTNPTAGAGDQLALGRRTCVSSAMMLSPIVVPVSLPSRPRISRKTARQHLIPLPEILGVVGGPLLRTQIEQQMPRDKHRTIAPGLPAPAKRPARRPARSRCSDVQQSDLGNDS